MSTHIPNLKPDSNSLASSKDFSTVNFAAGPAAIPRPVLRRFSHACINWNGKNDSILELGHRTQDFQELLQNIKYNLKRLLNIPDTYDILFLAGGARLQFAAIPMNILNPTRYGQYAISGYWSSYATKMAKPYGDIKTFSIVSSKTPYTITPIEQWPIDPEAAYLHITPNETIEGIRVPTPTPDLHHGLNIIADMSSCILSEPIVMKNYQLIYACAQKNLGTAGVTIVIVNRDSLGEAQSITPGVINYKTQIEQNSLFNTPPVSAIYLCGLVFEWLIAEGGIPEIAKRNQAKAKLLYDFIDHSSFYRNTINPDARSLMNVSFRLAKTALTSDFISQAEHAGLYGLKGHSIQGGLRASLYNAISLADVERLLNFMDDYAHQKTH